jgi:selenocysteine lyase/cysteine desulfurase
MEGFPILGELAYANHAAMSPWPLATRDAVTAFAEENTRQGPLAYAQWLKRETALRERVARLLNAPSAQDISLLSNTTEGVCIVANGLDWRSGDNLVTAADEFPTNRMAWEALAERGVEIRQADIRKTADAEASLLDLVDQRTRVLTVSAVQWNDGFRLDLERLGQACRTAGVLFFVDAIQQFGALPVDVCRSRIDFLAAGSHKWQMGPEGMGVFYCRAELRSRLRLERPGWHMLDDPYRFERASQEPSDSGRRFEGGSPNSLGQVALHASLGVLESVGMEKVGKLVLSNTDRLIGGLSSLPGVQVISRTETRRRSGIVCFTAQRLSLQDLYQRMKRQKVVCAIRGEAVRLSPHVYQAGAPLEDLLTRCEAAVT